MITEIREPRLLVTSDTHLGSFFCHAQRQLARFIDYACSNDFNVCINGDGLDILHTSLATITRDTSEFLLSLRRILRNGIKIYYVIGNHDIILERYLEDWGIIRIVPFLNVISGSRRIRVEHGHLYDPFFVSHPDLHNALTRASGHLLRIHPGWYNWYKAWRKVRHECRKLPLVRRLNGNGGGEAPVPGEDPAFFRAAEELAQRGFDAVIFGHTHHPCVAQVGGGCMYLNTGSWFKDPHYVAIDEGQVELKRWPV